MRGLLSVEAWAVKESVIEYYRRELTSGRMPTIGEKPKLFEYAVAVMADNGDGSSGDAQTIDAKAGQVAVVSVTGVMTRYGEACAYGTEDIAKQLKALDNMIGVSGVVIKWDSPGGDVNGTKVFSQVIASMNKPVVSYVVQADSAAYWGASQTDEIIMEDNAQAEVGSIGVYGIRQDVQGKLEKEGVKIQIIRADGSEEKALLNPYEEAPAEALAQQKSTLNAIRGEFIDMVKAGRPNVDESVFSGKTYKAKEAIKLGLADRVGTLQDAINRVDFLARKQARAEKLGTQNNSKNNKVEGMGWLSNLIGDGKVTDEKAAEAAVDNKVGEMTEQISNLMGQRDTEKAKVAELEIKAANLETKVKDSETKVKDFETKVKDFETQIAELKPKATKFDEISAEHETNKTYVENLKNAGINPASFQKDASENGGSATKKSYETAPWNAKAMEMGEKLNG